MMGLTSNLIKIPWHLQPLHLFRTLLSATVFSDNWFHRDTLVRHYKVKRDVSDLTKLQLFIQRTFEKNRIEWVNNETLEIYEKKLNLLISLGCKPYELVEYPRAIFYNEEQLRGMVKRLQAIDEQYVAIHFLKFIKPSASDTAIRKYIVQYLEGRTGCTSMVSRIAASLDCSPMEMVEILTRNPRLGTWKTWMWCETFVQKVEYLLHSGALLIDIKANTHVLINITLPVIEARVQQLCEIGANNPLRIGIIGRQENEFKTIVAKLMTQPKTKHSDESMDIIDRLPLFYGRSLRSRHTYKPKVDLLLAAGYTADEILAHPSLLAVRLNRILDSINYLQHYYIDLVSIDLVTKYAEDGKLGGRIRRPSLRSFFAKILGCDSNDIPLLPRDRSLSIDREVVEKNLVFLKQCGFMVETIRCLPIVLLHHPLILRKHCEQLHSNDNVNSAVHIFRNAWVDDPLKRLNLLQYSIEKATNFSHAVSTSSVEMSDGSVSIRRSSQRFLQTQVTDQTEALISLESQVV